MQGTTINVRPATNAINSARAAPLAALRYRVTPRLDRKDQAAAGHSNVVTAHKRKNPVTHIRSRETRKKKRGRSSVTGLKDTGVKVAPSNTTETTVTTGMKAEKLVASKHPANTRKLPLLLAGGTTTMCSLWKQRSAAHEQASPRTQFLHHRSLSVASSLR